MIASRSRASLTHLALAILLTLMVYSTVPQVARSPESVSSGINKSKWGCRLRPCNHDITGNSFSFRGRVELKHQQVMFASLGAPSRTMRLSWCSRKMGEFICSRCLRVSASGEFTVEMGMSSIRTIGRARMDVFRSHRAYFDDSIGTTNST